MLHDIPLTAYTHDFGMQSYICHYNTKKKFTVITKDQGFCVKKGNEKCNIKKSQQGFKVCRLLKMKSFSFQILKV